MTYSESAKGIMISKARALQELKRHGVLESEYVEFFKDCGDSDIYKASRVLSWLGY